MEKRIKEILENLKLKKITIEEATLSTFIVYRYF